jgi:hypothetical protein
LEQIEEKFSDDFFASSLAHETFDWYFELGDTSPIESSCARDTGPQIDPIIRPHTMVAAFRDFAGHFIRHKLKR